MQWCNRQVPAIKRVLTLTDIGSLPAKLISLLGVGWPWLAEMVRWEGEVFLLGRAAFGGRLVLRIAPFGA